MLGLGGISTCQVCRLTVTPGKSTVKHDNIFCKNTIFKSVILQRLNKIKIWTSVTRNKTNQTKPITAAQTLPFWSH